MESSKAKYIIGTKVNYKLDNPNIPLQYGRIKGSYYDSYLNKVYYTISNSEDGTTSEVPEELINTDEEDYGYETFDFGDEY